MTTQGMLRIVIAASSLLALGAVGGVTADRFMHRTPHVAVVRLADVQRDPMSVFDRAMPLEPEQRARVAAIMEKRQGAIDAVWRDTHIRLQATLDSVINEIAAELDPDQVEEFRRLANELHGQGRVRLHRRPPAQ